MGRRLGIVLGAGLLLGAVGNAVSPRGLSWSNPLGNGLRSRAAEEGLVPVNLDAARRILRLPGLVVLDSRPREEFRIGRLPGARSLPWAEAEEGRALPPPAGPVLVYCSNEFCESSLRLGQWLRSKGIRDVALLVEGYDGWWNDRGPIDQD
jgi:rhodanese-related sulfurtransferase